MAVRSSSRSILDRSNGRFEPPEEPMDQAAAGLVIDWTQMPTYNTIMSVAAGAGLLSLVWFVRIVVRGEEANYEAWALSFGVPGGVLLATGLHMTLTWPFA